MLRVYAHVGAKMANKRARWLPRAPRLANVRKKIGHDSVKIAILGCVLGAVLVDCGTWHMGWRAKTLNNFAFQISFCTFGRGG